MRFSRADKDLERLERELRARRSEPSRNFVRATAKGLHTGPRWFAPRVRWVLVGVVTAAVLAATASAHVGNVASSTSSSVSSVFTNLIGDSSSHDHGTTTTTDSHGNPSTDQYCHFHPELCHPDHGDHGNGDHGNGDHGNQGGNGNDHGNQGGNGGNGNNGNQHH